MCPCRYYVDGHDTFEAIASAIESAQTEIFITGWYISPEIYLRRTGRRPVRLHDLLLEAAKRGVRIYILAWNELKVQLLEFGFCSTKL